jgi:hypothetical protein
MPIVFNCTCGKPLRAKEESAGKRTKCPHCGAIVAIPGGAGKPAGPASNPDDPQSIDLAWPTVEAHPPSTGSVEPPSSTSIKIDSVSSVAAVGEAQRPSDRPKPSDGTLQYKVLGAKDQGMATGKFNPLKLEEALNEHARQGWAVKSAATIPIVSHSGTHYEVVVILER